MAQKNLALMAREYVRRDLFVQAQREWVRAVVRSLPRADAQRVLDAVRGVDGEPPEVEADVEAEVAD